MSDAAFRDKLRAEFDSMVDAVKHSDMFHYFLFVPQGQPAYWEETFSNTWHIFESLAQASEDAAERLVANLDTTLIKSLGEEAYNETSTTVENIRDDLQDWEDSEAAKRFRDDYLDHLENALEYQYQYAVALRGLADLQSALIRAAREGIVDVCRQTAARIRAEQAEAERRDRDLLASAVNAVFATAAGAITGGILGMVAGALTGFGAYASKALTPNTGGNPQDIYTQLFNAVHELVANVLDEQAEFGKGLLVLQKWTGNQREEMLPLELTPDGV